MYIIKIRLFYVLVKKKQSCRLRDITLPPNEELHEKNNKKIILKTN